MQCSRHNEGTTCEGAGHTGPFFQVECEDGEVRHSLAFADLGSARHWAEWGHCCTNVHTIDELYTEGHAPEGHTVEVAGTVTGRGC